MVFIVSELLWLRSLLKTLWITFHQLMLLYCDNHAALHISTNLIFHKWTKHIKIDHHYIREHIRSRAIATAHLPTRLQLANLFTKALGKDRFHFLLSKLGVRNLYSPT